ncbi:MULTISPECIES: DNA repair protein RecN [Azospira]|jgi:DNA repair protein RecN (Recombination protein N)|uniref:DNA repair protein RecN n=1 Tax=Azospira TaxID=146937 RepID=UPI001260515A|nr:MULTISPECIES: DNA repair protein RecN [Azospira]BBN87255.1 DNA repair protein RecN [Azospira sp. I09]
MLQRLNIRDFVLVDRLELDFQGGFGALTGETGAGKSILVDALAFVLGERADSGLLRAGAEKTEVGAEFDIRALAELKSWLAENDFAADDDLLLRRILDAGGRSRAYINGSAATLQQLRQAAEWLVDIHGQHAHQSLLRGEAQRQLLDAHAGHADLARSVGEAWRTWRDARDSLDAAAEGGEALAREREQLEWQVRELETLAFSADEWESLNQEHKRLAHAASLLEGAQFSLGLLAEGEGACEAQVRAVASRLDGLAEYDPALSEVAQLVQSAEAELAEAVSALRRYADRVDLDPARLAEVERRLEAVMGCARKFRALPEELPELLSRWQQRLAELGEAGDLAALQARVDAARQQYDKDAAKLSKARAKAAKALGDEVSQGMQELALGGGRFEIALVPVAGGNAHGLENIEFRIGGLAGSEARSLAKVASGGELSRISLAIQVVTSRQASVPTLIFDEVDVGIGGGVAEVVGRLLHRLGRERQVLCVTHLPQVAARADWQWQVAKSKEGAAIKSRVTPLDAAGRVEEIARMLGGVEITATTRQHAKELLGQG